MLPETERAGSTLVLQVRPSGVLPPCPPGERGHYSQGSTRTSTSSRSPPPPTKSVPLVGVASG